MKAKAQQEQAKRKACTKSVAKVASFNNRYSKHNDPYGVDLASNKSSIRYPSQSRNNTSSLYNRFKVIKK